MEHADLFPAVGDWAVIAALVGERRAIIHGHLPRTSKLSRKVAGQKVYEQIVAANVDAVFILSSLNSEFNLRRLERGLVFVWESGAQPVVVLTKSDLSPDVSSRVAAAESVAMGAPVHVVSSLLLEGLDDLSRYMHLGRTVALIGSSGVGKSTLMNCLMGSSLQRVSEVREADDKGRHTTTHRQLTLLPDGGLIIDTPGMRELQIWKASDGLTQTYHDIEELARECHFGDCLHRDEPGCAVKRAISDGQLDAARFNSYTKMQLELAEFALKRSGHVRAVANAKGDHYAQLLRHEHSKRGKRGRKLK